MVICPSIPAPVNAGNFFDEGEKLFASTWINNVLESSGHTGVPCLNWDKSGRLSKFLITAKSAWGNQALTAA